MFGRLSLDFVNPGFPGEFVGIGHCLAHRVGDIGANRCIQVRRRRISRNYAFGFADCRNNRILERDDLFDDLMAEQDRLLDHHFRQFTGTGLHHQDSVPGTGDDQVKLGFLHLFDRGIDHIFVVDIADPHAGDRSVERNVGHRQCAGGSDHGNDIGRIVRVDRHHRGYDMDIIPESVGKQGPNWPVNHPGAQNRRFRRSSFPFNESAGDFADGIHPFFIIDSQGKEIDSFPGRRRSGRSHHHRCIAVADQDSSIGLFGILAGFDDEWPAAEFKLKSLHAPFPPHISFFTFTLQIISYSATKENVLFAMPVLNGRQTKKKRVAPLIFGLLSQIQPAQQRAIPFQITVLEIIQQAAAMADHLQQTATGMMIFLVILQMLGQLVDPVGQNGDLNFRRTCVPFMATVFENDLLFLL